MTHDGMALGLDLGGSKISAVVLDARGQEHWRQRVATPAGDYAATLATLAELVTAAETALGMTLAVGLGHPGAERPDGRIKNANSTCLIGRSLRADLEQRLGRCVALANDADCFALSESRDGAATGARSVFGVILGTAQRLARRLCPQCKAPADIPHEALLNAGYTEEMLNGSWTPFRPVGCSACNNGYKGRVGIYQVMPITEELQRIILRDGSALEIAEQAKSEGVRSLRQSGLHKVRQGMTSLEEVLAVTNE